MRNTFQATLKRCMKNAGIGIADLRWFLVRDYHTVREWVLNGRIPEGVRAAEAIESAERLERLVTRTNLFPIPKTMSKRDRSAYMRLLGEGDFGRARVLRADSARRRLPDRNSKKRRAKPASRVRKRHPGDARISA